MILRLRQRVSSVDVFRGIVALLDVDVEIEEGVWRICDPPKSENHGPSVTSPKLRFGHFLALSHHCQLPVVGCWLKSNFKPYKCIKQSRSYLGLPADIFATQKTSAGQSGFDLLSRSSLSIMSYVAGS